MKKTILPAALAIILAVQFANAQNGESVNRMKSVEYMLASQSSASEQHVSLMDKMQKETEELIMTITPAPLISVARLIDQRLDANKKKKAGKHATAKKEENSCNL
mgnify:CR=1 FL=1